MSTSLESAKQFFEACETGKGWEACKAFCHPEATFSSQTAVLSDLSTLEGLLRMDEEPVCSGARWALRSQVPGG